MLDKAFIGNSSVCLVLGDNIFYGHGLPKQLRDASMLTDGALIFAYPVKDPERYGVVEFDAQNRAISIEEKPENPKSIMQFLDSIFMTIRLLILLQISNHLPVAN